MAPPRPWRSRPSAIEVADLPGLARLEVLEALAQDVLPAFRDLR